MDDPFLMGFAQSRGDLHRDIDRVARFHRTILQPFFETWAGNVGHDDEMVLAVLTNLVNCADIGVIQSGSRLCLDQKAGAILF